MVIKSKKELIEHISKGNEVEYLFFWGHRKKDSKTTKSCFSQWYESTFKDEEDGTEFKTSEHYMMAKKAELFNDEVMLMKKC